MSSLCRGGSRTVILGRPTSIWDLENPQEGEGSGGPTFSELSALNLVFTLSGDLNSVF